MGKMYFHSAARRAIAVFWGVIVVLVLAETGLRIGGLMIRCRDTLRSGPETSGVPGKKSFKILCLGSCFTVGVGLLPAEAYPQKLKLLLQQVYPQKNFTVINRGVRGRNLSYFVNNLEFLIGRYRPQAIILNINNRVGLDDINIFLSNRGKLSLSDSIRIHTEVFLGSFKVYKILRLWAEKAGRPGEREPEISIPPGVSDNISTYAAQIEKCEKAVKEKPRDARAWFLLSGAYFSQGLFAQAAESTRKAIELDPGNGRYYFDLFWEYILLNEYERAMEAQKKALSISPRIREVILGEIEKIKNSPARETGGNRFLLSDKYAMIGDYKEALRECIGALQLYPFCIDYYDKMLFYKWAAGERPEGSARAAGNDSQEGHSEFFFFEKEGKKPGAFIEEMENRGRMFREGAPQNGYEIFYRLLRYDLEKAAAIAGKKGIKIILENMGSCAQQQAIIHKVCGELGIPLVDLYGSFRDAPQRGLFFNSGLTLRLSSRGSGFMAEKIMQQLREKEVIDERPQ